MAQESDLIVQNVENLRLTGDIYCLFSFLPLRPLRPSRTREISDRSNRNGHLLFARKLTQMTRTDRVLTVVTQPRTLLLFSSRRAGCGFDFR